MISKRSPAAIAVVPKLLPYASVVGTEPRVIACAPVFKLGLLARVGKYVLTELDIVAGPSTPGVPHIWLYEFSVKIRLKNRAKTKNWSKETLFLIGE
jgi:hypothetical protein